MTAMQEQFHKSVRLPDAKRDAILDRLDSAAKDAPSHHRRESVRVGYRAFDVAVMVGHPGGGVGRFFVCVRNISAGGMSLIHGGFMHKGAQVRALLPLPGGARLAVVGTVMSCRHIEGFLHEVGVAFVEKIDMSAFDAPEARPDRVRRAGKPPRLDAEILIVGERRLETDALVEALRPTGAAPLVVRQAGNARDQLRRQPFDLVVVDLDGSAGAEAMRAVRMDGFRGPIVATTSSDAPPDADPGIEGEDPPLVVLRKPIDVQSFVAEVAAALGEVSEGARREPIESILVGTDARDLVGQYVAHVQKTVRYLRDGVERNNREKVRRCCQMLKATASGYGFPQLTEAAALAIAAIDGSSHVREAAAEVRRVEALAKRLRAKRAAA